MDSWEPAKSCGIVVPSAVDGSLARFAPTAPAKCTSPPKPSVTVRPLPFQSGLSGECFGKCSAVTVACWVVAVDVEAALARAAREEGEVDQEQEEEDAPDRKLTAPAHDPS